LQQINGPLHGFSRKILIQNHYFFLVPAVIASDVVPTLIAGFFFLPQHLLFNLPKEDNQDKQEKGISEEG
jgi:hypothetical protein